MLRVFSTPVILSIIAVGVVIGSGSSSVVVPTGTNGTIAPIQSGLSKAVTATFGLAQYTGTHYDAPFYGVVFDDSGFGPRSAAALGLYLNSTPISDFRFSGGLEAYDPTTGINYVAPSSGSGQYTPVAEQLINFTWFKAWCDSKTPHCQWEGELPAEENDSTAALHFANWYHKVLGFAPTWWNFGNEPDVWSHYGINMTQWSTTDAKAPTGTAYATMVHNYIAAIKKVYPSDKFIGMQDNCACNPTLVEPTTLMDGANLSAMAYHSYPWANDSNQSLTQFYGSLESTRNISYTMWHMRTLDTTTCTTSACKNLPIQIGEYNAGPVPTHSPFVMQYPGAAFMAASIAQALVQNVSMVMEFTLNWLWNVTNATINPEGLLYQEILSNMTMGQDYNVSVSAGGVGGVNAVLIKNGTRESLLIVDANYTKPISTTLSTLLFPVGLFGTEYLWGPSHATPLVMHGITLPFTYFIPKQGILLLTNY